MPPQTLAAGLERRTGTTLYLRSDLKSSARQAARRAGLTLSRHIESLLLTEIAARTASPISSLNASISFASAITSPPSKSTP